MSADYSDTVAKLDEIAQAGRDITARLDQLERRPSKAAALVDPRTDPFTSATGPWFFSAVAKARSRDHDEQMVGKAELAELGSRYIALDPAVKATLGSTDASGGFLIPNNMVAPVVEIATSVNPFRRLLTVINGVRGSGVDIPLNGVTSASRATVIAWGDTKTNVDTTLSNYTATLYTLAKVMDVSNQLLRHSAGAAEQLIRSQLGRSLAQGEAYYILSGSGTSEPKGLLTSIAAAPAAMTTAHTASDSTVAGSVRAAVAKAVEALADRNFEASAVVMNAGDYAHSFVQGADTAGFWIDENGNQRILGLPIVTTTALTGGTAIVGDFRAATLFVGDDYRVDVSSEAGDRWDKNLTGFRAEEEIGFNADPPVLAGAFQRITGLVP